MNTDLSIPMPLPAEHNKEQPLVSVIIPCYNQGRFLAEAVDSALGQTYPYVEVIVVDDGSTDNTAEVAALYGERIKYIFQKNAGPSAARNNGIRNSTGSVLASLDADDRWLPKKLEIQLPYLSSRPEIGLVYSSYQCFKTDHQAEWVVDVRQGSRPDLHDLLNYNLVSGGTPIYYRSVLDQVGWFDESLRSAEDWDVWIRIASRYEILGTEEIVAEYRRYEGSVSTNQKQMFRSRLRVLKKNCRLHTHCAACRAAVQNGRAEAYASFSANLCARASQSKMQKQYIKLLAYSLQAIWYNPQALSRLIRKVRGESEPARHPVS